MYLSYFIIISGEDIIKTEEYSRPQKIEDFIAIGTHDRLPQYCWYLARYQFRHRAVIAPYNLVPVVNGAAILRQHN